MIKKLTELITTNERFPDLEERGEEEIVKCLVFYSRYYL